MTGKEQSQGRTQKEDWLKLAIAVLVRDGIDQVKIQVMAKELGVSRSSFYWFFESLQDLHKQLLDHWLTVNTRPIQEHAAAPAETIIRAVINVFDCWTDESLFDPQLDMAVRLWARRDPSVREVVQIADDKRLEALTAMFRRFEYARADAFIRARVLYFTQIGHYALEVDDDLATRHSHVGNYLRIFTGCEPTEEDIEISRHFTFKKA